MVFLYDKFHIATVMLYLAHMQIITEIVTAVLLGYLGFTNMVANALVTLLDIDVPAIEETAFINTPLSEEETITSFFGIPSDYATRTIPNILLTSAAYQQAAAISALEETPYETVSDPTEALVNIYCTFTTDDSIRTTTGTGFFVHSKGVILTNAHVAQFLLLETTDTFGDASCTIRTGSPAAPAYIADLLYISPAWVETYATQIDAIAPSGTGERDYALLYVTETMSGEPLPEVFPALEIDTDLLPQSIKNTEVIAAGYPVHADTDNTVTGLFTAGATTTISELYTFGSNYADVFSIRGTTVGEQGASGGPVTTPEGAAIGMITTKGNDSEDGTGSLRAITLSHIDRTITEETGYSLSQNIDGDIPTKALRFSETIAPFLISLLTSEASS